MIKAEARRCKTCIVQVKIRLTGGDGDGVSKRGRGGKRIDSRIVLSEQRRMGVYNTLYCIINVSSGMDQRSKGRGGETRIPTTAW